MNRKLSALFLMNCLACTPLVMANSRANIEREIMVKTQALSQATNENDRNRLRDEITRLTNQLGVNPQSASGANTVQNASQNNNNMYRDTFYYRGPVTNPTNNTPYLDSPYARGYGSDTYVLEGQPVMAINHPQAYINQVAPIGGDPIRNATANPWQTVHQPQQQASSQFFPQPQGYGYGWMQPPYGMQQPYMQNPMMNMGYMAGYPQMQMGYGAYQMFQQQGRPVHQVQFQQQALNNASFDAAERFRNELKNNPLIAQGNQLQVEVVSKATLQNGQLQIVVKTTGGVTGQGVGLERIYLYAPNGAFLSQTSQAQTGQSGINVRQFRLSNQQKMEIDKFMAQQGLNQYGDPLGTVYAGGTPLSGTNLEGMDVEAVRHSLILKKFPQLVNHLGISTQN